MEMEALDLLKKNWQKDTFESQQLSESDLYKMLRNKSSSIVKWIFVISLIELGLGVLISMILSFTKQDEKGIALLKKIGLYEVNIALSILIYVVVGYFIFRFYSMYKKISTENNTKDLIASILKTRKVVKQYIAFNLTTFAIMVVVIGTYGFIEGYTVIAHQNGDDSEISTKALALGILIIVFFTAVLTLIGWFIYKLLYGILLKKLHRNNEELKKLDF